MRRHTNARLALEKRKCYCSGETRRNDRGRGRGKGGGAFERSFIEILDLSSL